MSPFHTLIISLVYCVTLNHAEKAIVRNSARTFKTVCYYPMSTSLNTTEEHPLPPALNPELCSHLIFIPTWIDGHNRIVPATQAHGDIFRRAIPVIRKMNPKLIIMASNGGKFDPVMESMKNTSQFVKSVVHFLKKYDFDGVDLDWEFPGWPDMHKPIGQVHNFSVVITELRVAFETEARTSGKPRFLLSAAVCSGKSMADRIYEYSYIEKAVDFVNMMGYDYHGPWEKEVDYNSPLYPENNGSSLVESATFWGNNIGKEKVMVGFPFYCHAFRLNSSSEHGFHAPANGKGECDFKGYTCVCDAIKYKNATSAWDNISMVPYIYYGDQWVTYDNEKSVALKTKWIVQNGYGGLMVWNMIADDYAARCDGKTHYPLMKTVLKTLNDGVLLQN